MKTNKIYTNRLIKLANHLQQITNHPEHGLTGIVTLVALEPNFMVPYEVLYQQWVFEELPDLFDEWYYTEHLGIPMCKETDEEEGTVAAVIDFFDLSLDEFSHLFDIEGFQLVDRFGGNILTFDSDGPELAHNIFELIIHREQEEKI